MPTIREAINDAYKTAMKARDEVGIRTLRLVNADLKKIEVDERRVVSDAEVLQVVQKNIKKRRETIEAATAQGRADVAGSEAEELAVLERFLPAQLSETELVAIVEATIKEAGATTRRDQGKVMSALMPKIQGRADGKLVAKLVSERLA